MSELPEGWKKSEHTPHIDGPNATLWVSDGGLVGVNEAAIIVYSKEFDEVVSVPLRAVQAACDASKNPQNIVVRWNTHEVGKDLVSINEVVRILEQWESGTVTSTYKTATEVVRAIRDEMKAPPPGVVLPDGWKWQDDKAAADGEDSDGLLRVSIYTNSENEWRLYADGPKGDVPLAAVLAVLRRANLIPMANREKAKCSKCNGPGCPSCFNTGKKLFEIGQRVVWANQDQSLAPEDIQKRYEKYIGQEFTVTALMNCPGFHNIYYVGIDLHKYPNIGTGEKNLVLDINLRPVNNS